MSDGEAPQRKPNGNRKPQLANPVFGEKRVILECPFCGMTLVKSDYVKIGKLLEDCDPPRGKVCANCGGVGIIRLSSRAKEIVRKRIDAEAGITKNLKIR